MSEPNIREYNFAVPGNIDRHIPGIPGIWPVGSIVFFDEDTNQVVRTIPEGAVAMVPQPVKEEKDGSDKASEPDKSAESEQANPVPPAVEDTQEEVPAPVQQPG